MHSSPLRYTVYQLLFALSTVDAAVAGTNIWAIHIDNEPAPPAESGPSISADAVRDPKYLPYEVVAIFGAYLIVTIAVGVSILTIGRRRRAIQRSPMSLGMDMMKPGSHGLTGEGRPGRKPAAINTPASNKLFGPSPVSPSKFWASPNMSIKGGWENITGKTSKKSSIANVSIITADESILEEERTRNEIEMDRLYAAVAEHEATKEATSPDTQYPPELQHLRHGMRSLTGGHGPATMVEPYPSRNPTTSPRADTTSPPTRAESGGSRRLAKKTPPPALSLHSTAHSSQSSFGPNMPRSARHFPISPPMGSPGMAPDYGDIYSENEPLTPRVYAPGPPPLPPISIPTVPQQTRDHEQETQRIRNVLASPTADAFTPTGRTHFAPSIRSSRTSVSTNRSYGLPRSPRSPREPISARTATFPRITEQPSKESGLHLPTSPRSPRSTRHTRNMSHASYESDIKPGFDFALSPAPSGHTIRQDGKSSPTESTHTTASARDKKKRLAPPQLTLNPDSTHGSTLTLPLNPSMQNLPLRNAHLPLRDLRSPTTQNMSIKATVLDRPNKRGPAGGLLRAPGTAGLAGPATPYSPYMPQTPMTPMTPSRLVGREERKKREREEKKRVLTEQDVVKEEDEMWE